MDNKKGVFLNIDTNRSESDLFQKHSVIKIENNIYQKIKDINSIEDLYNIILNNKPMICLLISNWLSYTFGSSDGFPNCGVNPP
mgnify:CR=1 FL=1